MKLITTHLMADFDALASILACQKLYPEAIACLPGRAEDAVCEYLETHPGIVKLIDYRKIEGKVKELILVDIHTTARIGCLRELLAGNVKTKVYDHHLKEELYGANITLLTEILKKKKLKLQSCEATLLALGIYEDTGALTYPSSTERDWEMLLWLVEKGADIAFCARTLARPLNGDQAELLAQFEKEPTLLRLKNLKVVISQAEVGKFRGDLASSVHRFRDKQECDAVFCLVKRANRIHLIFRSKMPDLIDAGKAARQFGGGGHRTAASATLSSTDIEGVKKRLIQIVKRDARSGKKKKAVNLKENMKKVYSKHLFELLKRTGQRQDTSRVFLVGGAVRDLIIKKENLDIDLVVEGSGIEFARRFASFLKTEPSINVLFGTAQIELDGLKIDIATAREEFYPQPASPPQVVPSSLRQDLSRRDFTINALAVDLNEKGFGDVLDFFGGLADLKEKKIRMIYPHAFFEDPSRILRAIRLNCRFNFHLEKHTSQFLKFGIKENLLEQLASEKFRDEFLLFLSEPEPLKALEFLEQVGGVKFFHPRLRLTGELKKKIKKVDEVLFTFHLFLDEEYSRSAVYLLVLTDNLTKKARKELQARFRFSRKLRTLVENGHESALKLEKSISKTKKNSYLRKNLDSVFSEVMVLSLVRSDSHRLAENISLYLRELRNIKPILTGDDLKALGYKPGPIFSRILDRLLSARLDKIVRTREDEERFVIDNFPNKE